MSPTFDRAISFVPSRRAVAGTGSTSRWGARPSKYVSPISYPFSETLTW